MLVVALAQLRFAASMAIGLPFSPRSLDRIVDALQATREELGTVGADGGELLRGPLLDDFVFLLPLHNIFPVMVVLGPLMVVQYLYRRRRVGAERTTRQYLLAEPV